MLKTNKEAEQAIRSLVFSKSINETVKRAVRIRLQCILDEEIKSYERWKDKIRHTLNFTRQKQIEREFKKRIQAARITIHWLTPFQLREGDVPTFVIRKTKEVKNKKPLLINQSAIQKLIELVPEKKSWNYLKP